MRGSSRRLRISAEAVALVGAVVCLAWAVDVVFRDLLRLSSTVRVLGTGLAFLAGASLLLSPNHVPARWPTGLLRTICAAVSVFAVTTFLLGSGSAWLVRPAAIILALAFVEEAVFRSMLPRRLSLLARLGWKARPGIITGLAALLPQLAFALSHIVVIGPASYPNVTAEALRLISAGLLYMVLARQYGIGFTTGVHASLNFELLYGGSFARLSVPLIETIAVALAALAVLSWTRPSPAERRRKLSSSHFSPVTLGGTS